VQRILRVGALAGVAGIVLTLASPLAAQAYERPPSPGPDFVWGMPTTVTDMPTDDSSTMLSGGWNVSGGPSTSPERSIKINGSTTPSDYYRVASVRFTEPYRYGNGVRVDVVADAFPDNRYPYPESSTFSFLSKSESTSYGTVAIFCSATEWTSPSGTGIFEYDSGLARNIYSSSGPITPHRLGTTSRTEAAFGAAIVTSGFCPYLVRMQAVVKYHTDGSTIPKYRQYVWTANQWAKGYTYDDPNKYEALCEENSLYQECIYYDPPEDGSNFGAACANGPVPVWLDFSWLPAAIGHYARCLFLPLNGWDREKLVELAYSQSSLAEVGGQISNVFAPFDIAGSCGPLFTSGAGTPLPGFGINTCSWTTLGNQVKPFLAAAILLSSGWFILVRIVNWTMGLLYDKRPDLLEEKES